MKDDITIKKNKYFTQFKMDFELNESDFSNSTIENNCKVISFKEEIEKIKKSTELELINYVLKHTKSF
ncbi:hypothetical protein HNP99_000484 [Flavobacterium sp. 28A]|uniref:hypothetical protein n=1 Tax=Flavobacterium sp. 28A TaxID=2735895 RepID=UPI00157134C1|nr:hypothetical protein [Flavobacterium sp. 28A]NRT14159.1 hypothetical protein [Flavobacterium sp. 28A]